MGHRNNIVEYIADSSLTGFTATSKPMSSVRRFDKKEGPRHIVNSLPSVTAPMLTDSDDNTSNLDDISKVEQTRVLKFSSNKSVDSFSSEKFRKLLTNGKSSPRSPSTKNSIKVGYTPSESGVPTDYVEDQKNKGNFEVFKNNELCLSVDRLPEFLKNLTKDMKGIKVLDVVDQCDVNRKDTHTYTVIMAVPEDAKIEGFKRVFYATQPANIPMVSPKSSGDINSRLGIPSSYNQPIALYSFDDYIVQILAITTCPKGYLIRERLSGTINGAKSLYDLLLATRFSKCVVRDKLKGEFYTNSLPSFHHAKMKVVGSDELYMKINCLNLEENQLNVCFDYGNAIKNKK
uniref:Tudor domain-containing protein n=1 Tax=Rhabditophanes sp. KR3021 TaxID=114890 RepID=A0AC35TR81_9BILA